MFLTVSQFSAHILNKYFKIFQNQAHVSESYHKEDILFFISGLGRSRRKIYEVTPFTLAHNSSSDPILALVSSLKVMFS